MKKTNYAKPTQHILTNRIVNILTYLCIQFSFIFSCCSVCFASETGNYAQKGANWLFEQLFWIALAVVVIAMIKLFAARNFVAGIVTLIAGGLVCFFIKSPESIKTIGDIIAGILGLQ